MSFELPRQPKPVGITLSGEDEEDVRFWCSIISRGCAFKGDDVSVQEKVTKDARGYSQLFIKIYPRAIND